MKYAVALSFAALAVAAPGNWKDWTSEPVVETSTAPVPETTAPAPEPSTWVEWSTSAPPAPETSTVPPPAPETSAPPAPETSAPPAEPSTWVEWSSVPPAPETSAPPAPETSAPPAPETSAPPAEPSTWVEWSSVPPAPETSAPPAPETSAPPAPETSAPPAPETSAPPAPETSSAPAPSVATSSWAPWSSGAASSSVWVGSSIPVTTPAPSSAAWTSGSVSVPSGTPVEAASTTTSSSTWTYTGAADKNAIGAGAFALAGLALMLSLSLTATRAQSCDSVENGYQCEPEISHFWGQYSAFYSVPSEISADIPAGCEITFAQILSRHGARDPTSSKTAVYNETVIALKANVSSDAFVGKYAFLADYEYDLGADLLSLFGQQQLINSGIKFFNRYASLAADNTPFVRAGAQERVVESALNWTQGFHSARTAAGHADADYPYAVLEISEEDGQNNTLNHAVCTNFEDDDQYYSTINEYAQEEFAATFTPAIQARLEADLPGLQLTSLEVIYLMELCPFNTVADDNGTISPWCRLFSEEEWHSYNYYQSVNKYYGYGAGNPLGPTQGVGWTNELIARLTNQPVNDHTSTNTTLDSNPETFPLGLKLYADFSHDNDMVAIFYALGLYNNTPVLSNTTITEAEQAGGYSAAWTASFASRAYVEKMTCSPSYGGGHAGRGGHGSSWNAWNGGAKGSSASSSASQELVRVIVNDRVIPLVGCGADNLGRCTLDSFVESLSFARSGGRWSECFT
ncbi:hypothetical protein DV738_g5533, partial [Chaetothyriales sp. CBS 135597]